MAIIPQGVLAQNSRLLRLLRFLCSVVHYNGNAQYVLTSEYIQQFSLSDGIQFLAREPQSTTRVFFAFFAFFVLLFTTLATLKIHNARSIQQL